MKRLKKHIEDFIALESAGGIALIMSAIVALAWSNLGNASYEQFLHLPLKFNMLGLEVDLGLHHFANEGLMAIFFLLVAAELREEVKEGRLSSFEQLALPVNLAFSGFVMPACIFLLLTGFSADTISGWAISTTTDIAFALGILGLFSKRVPLGLKVTLLALAIFDDLMAIVVIAIGYSKGIDTTYIMLSGAAVIVLFAMKYCRVVNLVPYFIVGFVLWAFMVKSGVHATLSGVILAFAIPYGPTEDKRMPLKDIQHSLHEFVAFFVVPLFTICNAGVYIENVSFDNLLDPISIIIATSLFVGKTVGIFIIACFLILTGWVKKPDNTTFPMLLGMSMIAGIGFTMSLFIGELSDIDPVSYKVGVLLGTTISAVGGSIVLWFSLPKAHELISK
ncbi:Na+/H+ antiporter NhaA [Psychromonas sp. SP041]|uniref:Na+/H+ antiporter NhaA n=1 Tax=Psychromonas sp. SP041 TaxID=1365007 RepID=UPI0010C7D0D7|nr:Na+/H+ antiporter NhaA [Psychromonas sp. SP041]